MFLRCFARFSGIKIISKIITKMEGKIHLHTNIKGTSVLIKHQKNQAKLEENN